MPTSDEQFALAWELHQAGNLRQAEEIYRRLLRQDPRDGRTWFTLANLCDVQDRRSEAIACCRQAMECCPHDPQGPFFLANALMHEENYPEAEVAFRRCLQLRPDQVEAMVNLGYVLGEQEKADEARVVYERALQVQPQLPEAHHNLANVLRDQGQVAAALTHYDQSLRQRPGYAKAYINRGVALAFVGRVDEAVGSIQHGLQLQPDFAEGYSSLGAALSLQEKMDEAIAAYRHALSLKPDMAETHWNLGLALLLTGNFVEGWPEFEWIWKCKNSTRHVPNYDRPRWDGKPLDGETILLHAEQGLGDAIHLVRYARLVQQRGGRTVVQCQRQLLPLLANCSGIDQLIGQRDPLPPYDCHASLQSVPGIVGTDLATIPGDVPYLAADPALVEHWRLQLAPVRGLRIGINWQGNPKHPWDRHRSIPLAAFEPLARIEGVHLISLQKGHGSEQLPALGGQFPVLSLGPLVDEAGGAFMDTAAILHQLDLVITADSAIAHLAGALARPVWVALSFSPDWRWLLGRPDSPWYPTMRLFRQPALGDWESVFAAMAAELRLLAARPNRRRLLLIEVSPGEFLDRLVAMEVELSRVGEPARLSQVKTQFAALQAAGADALPESDKLLALRTELRAVHDALRRLPEESNQSQLREYFRLQQRRVALQRAVDELLSGERSETS
jgi:tetratricopeptide (TPR) repeat protein